MAPPFTRQKTPLKASQEKKYQQRQEGPQTSLLPLHPIIQKRTPIICLRNTPWNHVLTQKLSCPVCLKKYDCPFSSVKIMNKRRTRSTTKNNSDLTRVYIRFRLEKERTRRANLFFFSKNRKLVTAPPPPAFPEHASDLERSKKKSLEYVVIFFIRRDEAKYQVWPEEKDKKKGDDVCNSAI